MLMRDQPYCGIYAHPIILKSSSIWQHPTYIIIQQLSQEQILYIIISNLMPTISNLNYLLNYFYKIKITLCLNIIIIITSNIYGEGKLPIILYLYQFVWRVHKKCENMMCARKDHLGGYLFTRLAAHDMKCILYFLICDFLNFEICVLNYLMRLIYYKTYKINFPHCVYLICARAHYYF